MAQQDKGAEKSRQQQQSSTHTTQQDPRTESAPKPAQQQGTPFSDWASI